MKRTGLGAILLLIICCLSTGNNVNVAASYMHPKLPPWIRCEFHNHIHLSFASLPNGFRCFLYPPLAPLPPLPPPQPAPPQKLPVPPRKVKA